MTYFQDLSPYTYTRMVATEKNVGWLSQSIGPEIWEADDSFLDRVWRYCKISVAQTRGIHRCELCSSHASPVTKRGDESLILGSAEIRVFSLAGDVYAAPNLIYHYILDHHYRPPPEFTDAVRNGAAPESEGYFRMLADHGWTWEPTEKADARAGRRFRAVKTSTGVKIVED
jgi:hypothetical protein